VTVSNQPPTNVPHFVDLDGVDDFVTVADAPNLSFGTGTTDSAFTIEMRIRADNVNAKRQLIGKWGEGTNQEYRVYFAAGTLRGRPARSELGRAGVRVHQPAESVDAARQLASRRGHV
jgi:hypothetical protein